MGDVLETHEVRRVIVVGNAGKSLEKMMNHMKTLRTYEGRFEHLWILSENEFLTHLPEGDYNINLARCQVGRCSFTCFQPANIIINGSKRIRMQPCEPLTRTLENTQLRIRITAPMLFSCGLHLG